jgi:hypothetical protein
MPITYERSQPGAVTGQQNSKISCGSGRKYSRIRGQVRSACTIDSPDEMDLVTILVNKTMEHYLAGPCSWSHEPDVARRLGA